MSLRPVQSSPAGYQQMEQLNSLSPNIRMHFLLTVSLYISYDTGWENLCKNRHLVFDDRFLYSHDLHVSSTSDIVRRS